MSKKWAQLLLGKRVYTSLGFRLFILSSMKRWRIFFFLTLCTCFFCINKLCYAQSKHIKLSFEAGLQDFSPTLNGEFQQNWTTRFNTEWAASAYYDIFIIRVGYFSGTHTSINTSVASYDFDAIYSSFSIQGLKLAPAFWLRPELGIGMESIKTDEVMEWVGQGSESEVFSFIGAEVSMEAIKWVEPFVRYRYVHVYTHFSYQYALWNAGIRFKIKAPAFIESRL